jgi:two-component system, NtrC family, response regulator HupR/HoxA
MQPKLLRVLQDGEIIPVGSARPERVDVRVVSASNRDLRAAVTAGSFREDLYYRLAGFPIALPPLRARKGDIALLAARFLATAAEHQHKPVGALHPATLTLLERYSWPGNVRELQNEIERAVALTPPGDLLLPERFSDKVRGVTATVAPPPVPHPSPALAAPAQPNNGSLRTARADFEARFIGQVFAQHQRNVSQSARALGISRISLQRKLKDYQIR